MGMQMQMERGLEDGVGSECSGCDSCASGGENVDWGSGWGGGGHEDEDEGETAAQYDMGNGVEEGRVCGTCTPHLFIPPHSLVLQQRPKTSSTNPTYITN